MATPSAKTLQTLDLAIIRFGNNKFTESEFETFVKEARNAKLDVCVMSTLIRYGFVRGEYIDVINSTYSPSEFASFVNDLMGDDLWEMNNKYEWDEKTQRFIEIYSEYKYHLEY